MTSYHRVAGSSPAGCKSSLEKGLQATRHCNNKNLKSAVIRLFSVLLTPLVAHVRTNPRNLLVLRIWAFITIHGRNTANMKLETKLRLT
jgi:hypothetical protein